jgi:hypothetical protein
MRRLNTAYITELCNSCIQEKYSGKKNLPSVGHLLPDDPGAGRLVLIEPDLLLDHLEEWVVVVHILHEDGDAGRGLLPHPRVRAVQRRYRQRVSAIMVNISELLTFFFRG